MKRQSLAAKYRPRTFGEVVGQEMAAAALSRAAAESRPAPAYLLSGTRGVGKTTMARIFAKALNCEAGPGPEPCDKCPQCQHVTSGNHVDVCEIDGASNTGVDDVRALRENIGFAPMEGRYKIFIVDEAHMLSKSAFNALLKTLEEPPVHTVFIFATTEAHRFPATIISRCQHFVFKHLPEDLIRDHLAKILGLEKIGYEDEALDLIARRAAGSVRDSLSLLDQVLAVSGGNLTGAMTRDALGLAGREFYEKLFQALGNADLAAIVKLNGQLLRSGADLGFFGRELASWLRNLFLFRQAGDDILPALGLSEDEVKFARKMAGLFAPAHLHAAWQMTLEGQRSMSLSPEPGVALELLLLNLAMLPRLLPVDKAPVMPAKAAPSQPAEQNWSAQEESVNFKAPRTWEAFRVFCQKEPAEDAPPQEILRVLAADWAGNKLTVRAPSEKVWERLQKNRRLFDTALRKFCDGAPPEIEFIQPRVPRSREELLAEYSHKPEVEMCASILGGQIVECEEKNSARNIGMEKTHEKHE